MLMKNLLFIPILCLSVFFISCGDDDKVDCLRQDFLGTYVGTSDCGDTPGSVSFTISAGVTDDQLIVTVPEEGDENSEDIVIELDFPPLTVDGCDVTGELDYGELGGISVTGVKSENTINLKITGSIFGETVDCSVEGTK